MFISKKVIFQSYIVFSMCVLSLPGLIILIYFVIPKLQTFSKFLYNLPDDWLENMVFFRHHYLYVLCVILENMAINSFFTIVALENCPSLSGPHIVSLCFIEQSILQFSGFTTLMCFYLMLFTSWYS